MVDVTTEHGISLKIPSDMTKQDNVYVNKDTGDSVTLGVAESTGPLGELTDEYVLALYSSKYDDVAVTSFKNGIDINGKEAFISDVSLKSPQGNDVIITLVVITDGKTDYVISFGYGSNDTEGSLVKNLEACIDSITISDIDETVEDVAEEGYATDEQKEKMVDMLVEIFNNVNTDFNLMVAYLDKEELIVEGSELTENLHKYTVILQEVRDGLTGETMTSADAEDFLDKIEATDKFIIETIDAYLE